MNATALLQGAYWLELDGIRQRHAESANPDALDRNGRMPLSGTVSGGVGAPKVVERLPELDAAPNRADAHSLTPRQGCLTRRHDRVVTRALLGQCGADRRGEALFERLRHLALLLLLVAGHAQAGCGEGRGICYQYKQGELQAQGECAVTTCAASDQYFFTHWDWDNGDRVRIDWNPETEQLLVNGKPGYSLPLPYKDDRMICYAVTASDELLCNDSGVF